MRAILAVLSITTLLNFTVRFVPDGMAWDYFAFVKQVETAALSLLIVSLIPYRNLAAKSVMFIWFVTEIVDSAGYLFWFFFGKNFLYPYAIKAILSVALLLYIWFKNYERESDDLDEGHFFLVGIRPKGIQDFLLSLIKEPVGGVGIYVQGRFYHYRKGRLQVHDRGYLEKSSQKYRIRRIRPVDEKRKNELQNLIGGKYEKWSLLCNCKTVLEPIMGERAKPWWR